MSDKPAFDGSEDLGRQLSSLRRNWTASEIVETASVDHLYPLYHWLQNWLGVIADELAARARRAESEERHRYH